MIRKRMHAFRGASVVQTSDKGNGQPESVGPSPRFYFRQHRPSVVDFGGQPDTNALQAPDGSSPTRRPGPVRRNGMGLASMSAGPRGESASGAKKRCMHRRRKRGAMVEFGRSRLSNSTTNRCRFDTVDGFRGIPAGPALWWAHVCRRCIANGVAVLRVRPQTGEAVFDGLALHPCLVHQQ